MDSQSYIRGDGMNARKRVKAYRLLFCLLVGSAIGVHGQAPTGSVSGTVTDQSAAVIPSATITITDKATSAARVVTANAEGLFSAPALPAGEYEVRGEVVGFKTLVRQAQVVAGG